MHTRRTLLTTLGGGLLAGTAGCLDTVNPFRSPPTLAYLKLANLSDSPHEFDIRVRRDEATVHESTHQLAEDRAVSGYAERCTWMEAPGSYVVSARVDSGEWVTQSVAEGLRGQPDSAMVYVAYDAWNRGRLVFFVEPDSTSADGSGGPCQLDAGTEAHKADRVE